MEIRFRGYDGASWMYGTAIDFHNETDTWYMLEFGGPEDDWIMVSGVGQYTGIHDKEGKEIYKDDILQEESTGKLFRCEWLDAIASFKLILMTDSKTMFGMSVASRSFTVVGNIHETGKKEEVKSNCEHIKLWETSKDVGHCLECGKKVDIY